MAEICAKFVSKKIRKIRWRPRDLRGNPNPEYFVTGTWDDKENELGLWYTPVHDDNEPRAISTISVPSDVNDICFCDNSTLVAGTGNGSASAYSIKNDKLVQIFDWKYLHSFKTCNASCTAVDIQANEMVTVGEDGKLNLINVGQNKHHKALEVDSCTVNDVLFTSHTEVLTANSRGTIKIWDLRSASSKPILTSSIAEDCETGVSSVDRHPFQGHVIAAGSYDGTLVVYDMRKAEVPVTILAGPESCLTEIRFHPDKSDLLFTSTECGGLWSWNCVEDRLMRSGSMAPNMSVWLSGDLTAQHLDIKEVLPSLPLAINSVDVSGERLVCGGDNEAFYYFPNFIL